MRRASLVFLNLAFLLAACPRVERGTPATPAPEPTPAPPPTPKPIPYVPDKRMEVGKMFNGAQVRTALETVLGGDATTVRTEPGSYVVEVNVRVTLPQAHRDIAQLAQRNSQLPILLPELPLLLEIAKVSPHWDDLYRLKVAQLRQGLTRLDNLISRHNLFDCETILELQHPASKRRALLIQADMDVDGDGSDSDRVPEIDGSSVTFQPFTSYRWAKKTDQLNSFIPGREAKLKQYETELTKPGITVERVKELTAAGARMRSEIGDLKKFSFLVAATDPFIVLPLSIFGKKTPFTPAIGDYCVVVHEGALYPAIVGDAGPAYKTGEGSLRLCKQLNERANAANRAVSDLKVTYLVFPGTADKPWDTPNLTLWRQRCEALLGEIGGYKGELFTWPDLLKSPTPPITPPSPTVLPAPGTSPVLPAPATPAPPAPTSVP